MHIVYFFSVDTALPSGKNRATRQKIEALKKVNDKVKAFTLDRSVFSSKLLAKIDIHFKLILYIVLNRRSVNVYISRGNSALLAHFLCKILGICVVREVHADIFDEIPHLRKSEVVKFFIRILSLKSYFLDSRADQRVYNNPILKAYHIEKGVAKESDKCVYNGGSIDAVVNISQEEAKRKFGLESGFKYLVFTGSASVWHGVHYLVELQKCFLKHGDKIRIVCGGGEVSYKIDPDGCLINITPLDDSGCSELIKAADACLLPVNNIRVSPGSPLKLYDYMINGVPVVSQQCMPGYSDEVENFEAGISVDYANPSRTRQEIINLLADDGLLSHYAVSGAGSYKSYIWEKRVIDWFSKA